MKEKKVVAIQVQHGISDGKEFRIIVMGVIADSESIIHPDKVVSCRGRYCDGEDSAFLRGFDAIYESAMDYARRHRYKIVRPLNPLKNGILCAENESRQCLWSSPVPSNDTWIMS